MTSFTIIKSTYQKLKRLYKILNHVIINLVKKGEFS